MSKEKAPRLSTYVGTDGVRVVHIVTDPLDPQNEQGPIIAIYLNDGLAFRNPPVKGSD